MGHPSSRPSKNGLNGPSLVICNGGPVGNQSLDLICSRDTNNLPAAAALLEVKGLHLISIGIDIFKPEARLHITRLIVDGKCDALKRRTLRSQISGELRFSTLSNRLLDLLLERSGKCIEIHGCIPGAGSIQHSVDGVFGIGGPRSYVREQNTHSLRHPPAVSTKEYQAKQD